MTLRRCFTGAQLLLVAAAVACVGEEPSGEVAERARRGRETYLSDGCVSCHGVDRQGSKTGPPLARVSRHWTADELVQFLRNPRIYPKDSRLRRITDRYRSEMAGLPNASDEKLRDLVTFLLSR